MNKDLQAAIDEVTRKSDEAIAEAYDEGFSQGTKRVIRDFINGLLDREYILEIYGEELLDDNTIRVNDMVESGGYLGEVDRVSGDYLYITWNKGCKYSECKSLEHKDKVTKIKQDLEK